MQQSTNVLCIRGRCGYGIVVTTAAPTAKTVVKLQQPLQNPTWDFFSKQSGVIAECYSSTATIRPACHHIFLLLLSIV
jgi:hypothetical protein